MNNSLTTEVHIKVAIIEMHTGKIVGYGESDLHRYDGIYFKVSIEQRAPQLTPVAYVFKAEHANLVSLEIAKQVALIKEQEKTLYRLQTALRQQFGA